MPLGDSSPSENSSNCGPAGGGLIVLQTPASLEEDEFMSKRVTTVALTLALAGCGAGGESQPNGMTAGPSQAGLGVPTTGGSGVAGAAVAGSGTTSIPGTAVGQAGAMAASSPTAGA